MALKSEVEYNIDTVSRNVVLDKKFELLCDDANGKHECFLAKLIETSSNDTILLSFLKKIGHSKGS